MGPFVRPVHGALIGACVALAACSASPVARVAPAGQVAASQVPAGRAAVKLVSPKAAYLLAEAAAIHHWVAADILEYVVELKSKTGADAFDHTVASVKLPLKGANVKTTAVFANLPWGVAYRAYVSALGNDGGVVAGTIDASTLTPMNTPAATADFDFTLVQNQGASLVQPVQVNFDITPFAGDGAVAFGTPDDGTFTNPTTGVEGSAE